MWIYGRTGGTVYCLNVNVTWKPAGKFVRLHSAVNNKEAKLSDDTIEI